MRVILSVSSFLVLFSYSTSFPTLVQEGDGYGPAPDPYVPSGGAPLAGTPPGGAQAKKKGRPKPFCLDKWEDCMAAATKPRPTASECDEQMFQQFGCPKPKPFNRGAGADYDMVINRESTDTDRQEDVNHMKLKTKDKVGMEQGTKDQGYLASESDPSLAPPPPAIGDPYAAPPRTRARQDKAYSGGGYGGGGGAVDEAGGGGRAPSSSRGGGAMVRGGGSRTSGGDGYAPAPRNPPMSDREPVDPPASRKAYDKYADDEDRPPRRGEAGGGGGSYKPRSRGDVDQDDGGYAPPPEDRDSAGDDPAAPWKKSKYAGTRGYTSAERGGGNSAKEDVDGPRRGGGSRPKAAASGVGSSMPAFGPIGGISPVGRIGFGARDRSDFMKFGQESDMNFEQGSSRKRDKTSHKKEQIFEDD